MFFNTRAGLVALILASFFTAFTIAAPLPNTSLDVGCNLPDQQLSQSIINTAGQRAFSNPKNSACILKPSEGLPHVAPVQRSIFDKIKEGFQKMGEGIKNVAQKAGGAIKDNAAKAGKLALKGLSAATSVAGKVVKFIPGVGTATGIGLDAASKGLNVGANAIKASLNDKENKAVGIMDKIQNPIGAATDAIAGAIKKKKKRNFDWEVVTGQEWNDELVNRENSEHEDLVMREASVASAAAANLAKFIPGVGTAIKVNLG